MAKVITDTALANLTGIPVHCRIHADPSTGAVIALDTGGVVRWYDGSALRTDFVATTSPRESMHYTTALFAVADVAAFVKGAGEVSERAMQWTSGNSGALYREAIRYRDRVLVVWGLNNARNLQSVGITTTEADARALLESFRTHAPKGFRPTTPHFVEKRGGIAREYWPTAKVAGAKQQVVKGLAHCIDDVIEWTTQYPDYQYDRHREVCASDEAAAKRFDQLELDWYERGGRPYEVEWMGSIQRRRDTTVFDWMCKYVHNEADPVSFTRALLEGAGLPATDVAGDAPAIVEHVGKSIPGARWVQVGERVGRVETKSGKKPGVVVYLDHALCAVATIKTDKRGRVVAKVKRDATLTLAKARWKAEASK